MHSYNYSILHTSNKIYMTELTLFYLISVGTENVGKRKKKKKKKFKRKREGGEGEREGERERES